MKSVYGMERDVYVDLLKDRLLYIGKQYDSETEQIADMREDYDRAGFELIDAMVTIDREIITRAGEIAEVIHGFGDEPDPEEHWAWNIDRIALGTFPLERIPAHVRDLAKELYYDRAA